MSRIEQIIDEIEEYIDGCKLQPFSSTKIVVDKSQLEELLVELRHRTPEEIKKYQKMLSNKDAIIADANSTAQNILNTAQVQAESMLNQHEIMKQAQAQASELIDEATRQAQGIVDNAVIDADNIRMSAIAYTDEMLASLQVILSHTMEEGQNRFTQLMNSLQSSYEIVTENRKELNPEDEDEMDDLAGVLEPEQEFSQDDVEDFAEQYAEEEALDDSDDEYDDEFDDEDEE